MIKKNLLFLAILIIVLLGILIFFPFSNQTNKGQKIKTSPTPTSVIINSPVPSLRSDNFVTMNDGLKIEDIATGSAREVKSGDTVTVNYVGTLTDGTKFDSSYDRNMPFTTLIGVGQVIKGWDEGIIGMKVGGKRKLVIPSSLGYGDQSAGSIPPNSTLIFEVELMSVK